MEAVTRKRIMRMLDALPEERLYQVLDYIEFLEAKYARETGRPPDAFQRFAERVEDQMRVRSLAPKAMKGTMRVMSTAGRVLDGVRGLGQDLVGPVSKRGGDGGGHEAGSGAAGTGGTGGRKGPGRAEAGRSERSRAATGQVTEDAVEDGPAGRRPGGGGEVG